MTACMAPLTTVVLDAAPSELGGPASGVNNAAARLGGLVAVAALGSRSGARRRQPSRPLRLSRRTGA